MCGIGGWFGRPSLNQQNDAFQLVESLRHRGPDQYGIKHWSGATLIHTRLSIIDLSPAGTQPMPNEDGTIWVVFNGEIYNHQELRLELTKHGHRFNGHSDTEILPHLYEEHGAAFLEHLQGMFAIALYDTRQQSFILARDRFGIKPLFYAPSKERISFASELNALLTQSYIDTSINVQSISDYMALSYIPAPNTFYSGIKALEPGQLLLAKIDISSINWHITKFHNWSISINSEQSLESASEKATDLIISAVRSQLESDVPLGTLLSGGIDSSLVSCMAQSALSKDIRSFNVRFADDAYDETWAAISVSKQIGSNHNILDMGRIAGTWDKITQLLLHNGQPFADTSLFAVDAISSLIRQYVTVALSGDGGDEAFGGYSQFRRLTSISPFQRLPKPFWQLSWLGASMFLNTFSKLGFLSNQFPMRVKDLASRKDNVSIVQNMFTIIHDVEHENLCGHLDVLPVRRLFERQWGNYPSKLSNVDTLSTHVTEISTRLQMANSFLFKVDIGSMRHGLEIRVPMLNEELFSFGINLPHHLKANSRQGKLVLRQIAEQFLPPRVVRKPKQGFSVPVDIWVDSDFRSKLSDTLLHSKTRISNYLEPNAFRPIVESFCKSQPFPGIARSGIYRRVIMLLALHLSLNQV